MRVRYVSYIYRYDNSMMAGTFTSASPIRMVCVSASAVTVEQVYSPCSDLSLTRLKKVVFPTPSSPKRMILYSGRWCRGSGSVMLAQKKFLTVQPHPHISFFHVGRTHIIAAAFPTPRETASEGKPHGPAWKRGIWSTAHTTAINPS